jgi:cytoskeleton protein RodZ
MALFTRRKHSNSDRVAADQQDEGPQLGRRTATIGDLLRDTREQYGTTVEQIGAALRIRPVFLQAIEDNHYDRLPGPVYALGFVRTYADYLGLDGEVVAQRFKSEAAGLETKPDLSFPMPLSERSMPGGALLLVALIVAACAYAIWYYRAAGEHGRSETVAEVPSQLIPLPPPAAAPSASAVLPPDLSAEAPLPGADDKADDNARLAVPPAASPTNSSTEATPAPPAALPAVPPPAVPTAPAPASPPPAPAGADQTAAIPEPPAAAPPLNAPRVYGVTNGPVRIVIKATADSWVQVRDADQSVISMRVLKPGETYRVPDRPGLVLRTGNAGGLDITVDGRPVASVGPVGKTRNVALDPERLVAGTAALE